jgi:hypothetical protein
MLEYFKCPHCHATISRRLSPPIPASDCDVFLCAACRKLIYVVGSAVYAEPPEAAQEPTP